MTAMSSRFSLSMYHLAPCLCSFYVLMRLLDFAMIVSIIEFASSLTLRALLCFDCSRVSSDLGAFLVASVPSLRSAYSTPISVASSAESSVAPSWTSFCSGSTKRKQSLPLR